MLRPALAHRRGRRVALLMAGALIALGSPLSAQKTLKTVHGTFDPLVEPFPARAAAAAPLTGQGAFIVQFDGRLDAQIAKEVGGEVEILDFLPEDALVIQGSPSALAKLETRPDVRWMGELAPGGRLAKSIWAATQDEAARTVELDLEAALLPGADTFAFRQAVRDAGGQLLAQRQSSGADRYLLRLTAAEAEALAGAPGLYWLEPAPLLTRRNNSTVGVIQSDSIGMTPIWDRGLTGLGQIIGHLDGGIDMTTCFLTDTVNPSAGPAHRKVLANYDNAFADVHGTHTAGTALGWNEDGTMGSAGVAYEARIVHGLDLGVGNFRDDPLNPGEITLEAALLRAQSDGAFIHTNSWGDDSRTSYTLWCRDIDKFSHENPDSLVIFASTNLTTLKTPENAKNVLAVGGTWQAPSQNLISTGGEGPTADGRRKPEIFAPGRGIVSASTSFGSQDCRTQSLTGTSMACPAVAGAAALVRQYYVEGWHPSGAPDAQDAFTPSGALIKATLLNGTRDMTGAAGYPSFEEGWGRLVLEDALCFGDETRRAFIADVRPEDGIADGATRSYTFTTSAVGTLAVTMAFMDYPAAHLASGISIPVSNLDLTVASPAGSWYKGNIFLEGVSATSGRPDAINNVERVVIPDAPAGEWTVRVRAAGTPMGPQSFALVATGEGLAEAPSAPLPSGWSLH